MNKDTLLMHIHTGSIDTYDSWECEHSDFWECLKNGTLVEVNENGEEI